MAIFTSYSLDFLFITETWLKHGDLMPLVEIAPLDCAIFSTPQASGHVGGVTTICRSCFKGKTVPTDTFFSFKIQLLKFDVKGPVLCAFVYRPPKWNKDFICTFSYFLSDLVTGADRLLIIWGF